PQFSTPTEFYTLSLHDALPIWLRTGDHDRRIGGSPVLAVQGAGALALPVRRAAADDADHRDRAADRYLGWHRRQLDRNHRIHHRDRKSTRLNSSHLGISYAVFC